MNHANKMGGTDFHCIIGTRTRVSTERCGEMAQPAWLSSKDSSVGHCRRLTGREAGQPGPI